MLATLLLSAAAGALVTRAEPHLARLVEAALPAPMKVAPGDFRVFTLLVLLGVAAILVFALRGASSLFLAAVAAGLGYFHRPLIGFLRDPDSFFADPEDDWDGQVRPPRAARDDAAADDGPAAARGEAQGAADAQVVTDVRRALDQTEESRHDR